jgi:hypothetical protein
MFFCSVLATVVCHLKKSDFRFVLTRKNLFRRGNMAFYRVIRSHIFRVLMTLFGKITLLSYHKYNYMNVSAFYASSVQPGTRLDTWYMIAFIHISLLSPSTCGIIRRYQRIQTCVECNGDILLKRPKGKWDLRIIYINIKTIQKIIFIIPPRCFSYKFL